MNDRSIICIDLKSFFASVECVERGLDPFKVSLVVADPSRGGGAITLAATPYLKSFGVPSRGRVYTLPKNINIIFAPPRMSLYIKASKEVIKIYLKYISEEDMHIYSIDEVFLDVTDYLKLYKTTAYDLAYKIMNDVKSSLGLTSTCGIGPNLLLAKVAMDIEAKHTKDNIAYWTKDDIKTKLWEITPLSKMWGIGNAMEKKLNDLGIYKIGDINKYDISFYKKRFGIMGEELWEHANGIDNSSIKEEKTQVKGKTYGMSQVLFKDYTINNIPLIIREMTSILVKRLRDNKKTCSLVSFGISYSKAVGGGYYHSKTLPTDTDSETIIYNEFEDIFKTFTEDLPIRKVSISVGKLKDKSHLQLNLFEDVIIKEKEDNLSEFIDDINDKYGKNSILKASSLMDDSTIHERNKKIGGHTST